MKRACIALIASLTAILVSTGFVGLVRPSTVAAQDDADMSFGEDEAAGGGEGEGGEGEMSFGEGETEGGEGDAIDNLAGGEGGGATEGGDERDAPERNSIAQEEIFAVQQIYALRINRVELAPSFAATLNDPFVSHLAASLGLNYWWTNVLAVGANFLWYEGLESESDLNFFVRRSTRLAVPISSYQFGAHLFFTYVPIYGKFAGFNEFIFQWDAYIAGGVGLMQTRPVPVVDPEVRSFDYDIRVAFNLGLGLRIFITRWLTVFGEIRNYMYLDQLENTNVALGAGREDPSTWLEGNPAFTSNVTVHVGLTIFLPPEFDYQRPR